MKFRWKITLCMVGLLSVLFGAGGSLLIGLSFQDSLERERSAAYNAYQMVLGTLQIVDRVNGRSEDADLARTLEQLSGQNAEAWTALRLYTAAQPIYEYNASGIAGTVQPLDPGGCTIRYEPAFRGGQALVLSGALEAGSETLYLDMARDISSLFEARRVQQRTYQWVFLLMAASCALLSYSVARVLTAPLVRLSEASRAIAEGELSSRALILTKDEVGLVARDFNAMAQALEEKICELKDAADHQERFMGSFAHEVKTPMTSIIGYADLLRGQTLTADEQTEAANYIVAEGKRLETLSGKLLDLLVVKKGSAALAPMEPAALIQGLAAHLGPIYAKQGVTLTCACEAGTCLLEPDLVKSLLVNLWDNARKAMEGQGGSIHTQAVMLPDGCRIVIRDSGRGIPPPALEHLTEAFYRVDKARARAQGGAGLGLALCEEIAALHGGSLGFESVVGEGTTVTVELKGGAA